MGVRDHLQVAHCDLWLQFRYLNSRVPASGLCVALGLRRLRCLIVGLQLHGQLAQGAGSLAAALGAYRRRLDLKELVCTLLVKNFSSGRLNWQGVLVADSLFLWAQDTLVELGRFILGPRRVPPVLRRRLAFRILKRTIQFERFIQSCVLW